MKNLVFLCLLAFLFSCQSGKDKVQETAEAQSFDNERENFFKNMETVKNAAAEMQATGADFNSSLLSDPSLYSQYVSDTNKSAANLGIYLSDLNYSAIYGESDDVKKFFNSAIELSQSLGVDKTVLEFLVIRYNENISENDSVINVVNELYENSTKVLKNDSKERVLGVTMSAYQIENLHLALGVIETYPKDILPEDLRIQILIPLFEYVLNQQKSIEIIHSFLQTLGDPTDPSRTPYYYEYNVAFKELIGLYKQLNVDEVIAENKGSELLNDEVLIQIREKVNAIRDRAVSTEM